jgi:hypothetical protein
VGVTWSRRATSNSICANALTSSPPAQPLTSSAHTSSSLEAHTSDLVASAAVGDRAAVGEEEDADTRAQDERHACANTTSSWQKVSKVIALIYLLHEVTTEIFENVACSLVASKGGGVAPKIKEQLRVSKFGTIVSGSPTPLVKNSCEGPYILIIMIIIIIAVIIVVL